MKKTRALVRLPHWHSSRPIYKEPNMPGMVGIVLREAIPKTRQGRGEKGVKNTERSSVFGRQNAVNHLKYSPQITTSGLLERGRGVILRSSVFFQWLYLLKSTWSIQCR